MNRNCQGKFASMSLERQSHLWSAPLIQLCFLAVVQIAAEATMWLETELNVQ